MPHANPVPQPGASMPKKVSTPWKIATAHWFLATIAASAVSWCLAFALSFAFLGMPEQQGFRTTFWILVIANPLLLWFTTRMAGTYVTKKYSIPDAAPVVMHAISIKCAFVAIAILRQVLSLGMSREARSSLSQMLGFDNIAYTIALSIASIAISLAVFVFASKKYVKANQ